MNRWLTVLVCLSHVTLMGPMVHMVQLESYQAPGILRSFRQNAKSLYAPLLMASALPLALGVLARIFLPPWASTLVLAVASWALGLYSFVTWRKQPAKKPLVFTARIKRLVAILALVEGVLAALCTLALTDPLECAALAQSLGLLLLPLWVLAGSALALPLENAVKAWYLRDAARKLAARKELIRIGITGSYGKTSTKVILGTLLSEKYNTLITPASYNTPMGITRVVRERLTPETEVFVAEMGARHVGDIREICDLVKPTYGLITSVGPQHLETFHTLERIISTKYELIDALPDTGVAFFPTDSEICRGMWARTTRLPARRFGLEGEGLTMTARDIAVGPQGCTFTLVAGDGETCTCTTRLLGQHNIQNILGSAAVARELGLTLEEIAAGIGKLEPVEHRLQILPTGNGVTVIDDAFNSNPAGARAALEVISTFTGRRIVVTPGLVELGPVEEEENIRFGREMAETVTFALLVGRNAPALEKGMLEGGFEKENIIITRNLAQASAALGHLTQAGDVVLFENDLPDQYEI